MRPRSFLVAAALGAAALVAPVTPASASEREHIRIAGASINGDPLVDGFAVLARVPAGRALERVSIEFVDNTMPGPDPGVDVFGPGPRLPGVHVGRVGLRYSIRFPLALWNLGTNILRVRATTTGPSGRRAVATRKAFSFGPGWGWGIGDGGEALAPTVAPRDPHAEALPPDASRCPFVLCKD